MLICLAVAFFLFLTTRSFLDPAEVPHSVSKETLIETRCKQLGICFSNTHKGEELVSTAPSHLEDIPLALESFFAQGGFTSSMEETNWLVTRRFSRALISEPIQDALSQATVNVYRLPIVLNSYVVEPQWGGPTMLLMMEKESGKWKIDNIIPHKFHDAILDLELTNWECNPLFDY